MNDQKQAIPDEWAAPPQGNHIWKVIATVAVLLIGTDLLIGSVQSKLSMDLVHQAEIPAIIESFSDETGNARNTLFLGNSLIREGIDPTTFGGDVFKINPDDTSIVEWRYLFDGVAKSDMTSDHQVFLGYAQNQLTDDSIVRPRRLGSQYLTATTLPSIWSTDVTDFGGRCELLLSRVSASIANAERIRTRVLAMIVPQYETTAQRLNQAVVMASTSNEKREPTYDRLQHVIDTALHSKINLTIIAIPVGEAYELEPGLLERLANAGVPHIDGRNVSGIHHDSFPDGYHMDGNAAKLFTAFVREEFANGLAR